MKYRNTMPLFWRIGDSPMEPGADWFTNGVYTVTRTQPKFNPIMQIEMIHLCFSRCDGGHACDWREKQEIKNALVGPEAEAVEIYPAESRKVDGANQFHLWCIRHPHRFPFGYTDRMVSDGGDDHPAVKDARQRPGSGATPEDEERARDAVRAAYGPGGES